MRDTCILLTYFQSPKLRSICLDFAVCCHIYVSFMEQGTMSIARAVFVVAADLIKGPPPHTFDEKWCQKYVVPDIIYLNK